MAVRHLATVPDAAPRRALALIRVSKERDEMLSPDIQRAAIEKYCKASGYTIVDWVVGIDESGSRSSSKWWRRLDDAVERIERGEADIVVVWKFSRTARHRRRWAVAVDRIETAGGYLESALEPNDRNAAGRFTRGMFAELNAFTADMIGEQWKEAHALRLSRGLPATGGDRFGYTRPAKDIYEPDPITGPVLAELYRRAAAGQSVYSLAVWLNSQGILTIANSEWSRTRVRLVLDSGFGAGLLLVRSKTASSEHLPGIHPAIISPDLWAAYQRSKVRDRIMKPGGNATKKLLTGIIVCGDCGNSMSGTSRSQRGTVEPGYGCNRYQRLRLGRYVSTQRSRVEGWVRDQVQQLAGEIAAAAMESVKTAPKTIIPINDAGAIGRELHQVEEQLRRLALDFSRPVEERVLGDDDAYRAAAAQLRSKKAGLIAREVVRAESTDRGGDEKAVLALAEAWAVATDEELRRLVHAVVGAVVVSSPPRGTRGATYRLLWRWELRD